VELASLLPIVAIALLFWLLVIRPQSRKARELRDLQSALNVGDRVMLTSGIYGTVHELGEDSVDVEIAPGTVITVVRPAIGRVVPPVEEPVDETATDKPVTEED
jgi:preprotein translocase subunit YajC